MGSLLLDYVSDAGRREHDHCDNAGSRSGAGVGERVSLVSGEPNAHAGKPRFYSQT